MFLSLIFSMRSTIVVFLHFIIALSFCVTIVFNIVHCQYMFSADFRNVISLENVFNMGADMGPKGKPDEGHFGSISVSFPVGWFHG